MLYCTVRVRAGGTHGVSLDNPLLKKLLHDVGTGALQLPDFQREWKWGDERIKALIATVTLDYPLGVVMALQTAGTSPFRARPLHGAEAVGERTPELLLLDGQQRLTSLFQALHRDQPVETVDGRNKDIKVWYYIDIAKAVGPPSDRDEAIVSVPESRIVEGSSRRPGLDLSTIERECEAGMFPLHIVFDTQRTTTWQKEYVKLDDAHWDAWSDFKDLVLNRVQAFNVPMINLPADTTMDAVCAVFERVNTGGIPLNVFELLTATYAGDQAHVREFGTYYQLPEEWKAIKERLVSQHPVFGSLETAGSDDGLSSSDFLQAVALLRTWELKQSGMPGAVSCKRRDLLNLPLTDFRRLAPRIADAFAWVGSFLANQCIVRSRDLPYRTQLVPLATVRAILGEATDEFAAEERIGQWYWNGVLGEMYGGAIESRFSRDVEQLVAWIRGEHHAVPDTVNDAAFFADRLDTLTTRNSAAYKGIYALLIKQGAVDWYFTEAPLNPARILAHAVDVRQIFPKSWADKQGGRHAKHVYSIVNKTPLSHRASRSMTGLPGSYLKALQLESGMRPEWFDDVIATHLIDPSALHELDYERFYESRAKQLQELVDAAMGKRTVIRDGLGG